MVDATLNNKNKKKKKDQTTTKSHQFPFENMTIFPPRFHSPFRAIFSRVEIHSIREHAESRETILSQFDPSRLFLCFRVLTLADRTELDTESHVRRGVFVKPRLKLEQRHTFSACREVV